MAGSNAGGMHRPHPASPGAPAGTSSRYRSEIDGLRALAVLAVIVNHLSERWLPGGFLGVDVFFVISGYVITASIVGRGPQPLRPFLAGFYRRRVQRLAPALIVCVAITALLTCLFVPDPTASLLTGATALFGVSNLYLQHQASDYFGSDAALNTFTQTWSLGVEEQFYLIYPLLAWLLGLGRAPGLRGRLPFLALLALVSMLSLQGFRHASLSDPGAAYFLTSGRLWELAAGGLLFELRRLPGPGPTWRLPPGPWALPPFAALLATFWMPSARAALSTPIAVAATVLLLWALERPGLLKRGLMLPPLRHLGLISYSLYLWHWSVLSLGRWTVGLQGWWLVALLALMGLLAELSYRWIETPLRRGRWATSAGRTLLKGGAASGTLAGLLAWLALGGGGHRLYAGERTPTIREQLGRQRIEGTALRHDLCHFDSRINPDQATFAALARRCTAPAAATAAGSPGGGRMVFVAGDSHASALMPLESDLRRLGFGNAHLSKDGCPFPIPADGILDRDCGPFQHRWEQHILQTARPGDVVLIAGYWLSHLGTGIGDTRDHLLGPDGRPLTGSNAKIAVMRGALNAFAARAERRGLKVLVLGAGPRLLDREACLREWFRPVPHPAACARAFAQQLGYADWLTRELGRGLSPGIHLIDPLPLYCPQGCTIAAMRQVLFDRDHPSDTSVRRLQAAVLQAIGAAPRQTAAARKLP